jgi:hypothetical protein
MKKREFLAMGGAVPLMLAGCGGSGSGSAQVRLVNASVGYPKLGLVVNTTNATSTDVAYGSASPFAGVPAGSVSTQLTVTNADGTVSSLPVTTRTLNKDARYTMVAYGFATAPKSVLILENQTTPDTGFTSFNVLNTSVDVGAVDVYVSPPDVAFTTVAPQAQNVTGVSQSAFTQVTQGTYTVTVVGAAATGATTNDVRLTIPNVVLGAQTIVTLILTPGASGVLANGILMVQATDGTVTNYPNTFARVALIAGTGNSGTVTASVGNTVLGTNVASPRVSGYKLVPAGQLPSVTVDSTVVPVLQSDGTAATPLQAGSDYTLLAWGSETAPQSTIFLDDNRLPSVPTQIKARLLNAVLSPTTLPLTLNVNFQPVASDIEAGQMSSFTTTTPNSSGQTTVGVNSGGFVTVVPDFTATLTPGGVYTMVVAGEANGTDFSGVLKTFTGSR